MECCNRLFCCNQTCYCIGMASVTSSSRYVASASRYQSRSPMYIQGLIPPNWPKQFRLLDSKTTWIIVHACLTLCMMLGNFSCFCCCLLIFSKFTFGFQSSFRNVIRVSNGWIQIRTDILIWVQTVRKGYQQITKVAASKESHIE